VLGILDNIPLSSVKNKPNEKVRKYLKASTSAAQAGAETWAIMKQTGHRSEKIVQRDIRDGKLFLENQPTSLL